MDKISAISLAAISLAFAVLSPPGTRAAAAAEPATRQETLSETYRITRANDVEFQKIAPFKVFDNLYYVGPGYVGVWLIPTSAGIIMIDSAQEPYVDFVMDNIKKVGFDLNDIKYILLSHGHLDHFGGAARIQEASGARVAALDEDWQMMEQVGSRPGRDGGPSPRAPKRDMVVKEGDTLTLGGTTLKFYHHPGHTPGVLSAEFTVRPAPGQAQARRAPSVRRPGGVDPVHQAVAGECGEDRRGGTAEGRGGQVSGAE
jgi:hypothetical protein